MTLTLTFLQIPCTLVSVIVDSTCAPTFTQFSTDVLVPLARKIVLTLVFSLVAFYYSVYEPQIKQSPVYFSRSDVITHVCARNKRGAATR
jgi:hypothetical protein